MMTVMFDSNVYRRVLQPADFPNDPQRNRIERIHKAICDKTIKGYLSEVIFQIEAIKKADRKNFYKLYTPTTECFEKADEDGIQLNFLIRPSENRIPIDNYRSKYIGIAEKLGVDVIKENRLAMPNSNVPKSMFLKVDDFHEKNEAVGNLQEEMEKRQIGFGKIKQICSSCADGTPWFFGLPYADEKMVQKAFSEWADGDALAACYGYKIQYFCTEDQGKSAGFDSVFSDENRQWLKDDYGMNIVSLDQLADML